MPKKYRRILVAVDGSKEADWAFKKACEMAKEHQARLYLVHVIDIRPFSALDVYDQSIADRADRFANELLESYEKDAVDFGLEKPVRIIEYGSPKIKIAKDAAKEAEADLIICGATGLNAMERFLIGSVSEHIVRYAKCDVLVVRTPND
jgi:Universal stress protein family.